MPQRAGRCLAGTKGLAMRYAGWVVLALLAGVPVARAHDAPPRPHAPAITAPVPAAPNPESPAAITIRDGVLTGPMGPDPHGTPAASSAGEPFYLVLGPHLQCPYKAFTGPIPPHPPPPALSPRA